MKSGIAASATYAEKSRSVRRLTKVYRGLFGNGLEPFGNQNFNSEVIKDEQRSLCLLWIWAHCQPSQSSKQT